VNKLAGSIRAKAAAVAVALARLAARLREASATALPPSLTYGMLVRRGRPFGEA
jgi:hypothetical protein